MFLGFYRAENAGLGTEYQSVDKAGGRYYLEIHDPDWTTALDDTELTRDRAALLIDQVNETWEVLGDDECYRLGSIKYFV